MTKAELVSKVALETGFSKNDILAIVEATMDCIESTMVEGENVYLRGFGSFVVKQRKAKIARNILRKTSIEVPARLMPTFKPSKEFIQKLQ